MFIFLLHVFYIVYIIYKIYTIIYYEELTNLIM